MRKSCRQQSRLHWTRDPVDWEQIENWPNAHLSRQIVGPVHRWHVQSAGDGPELLLLHGAGGSTHSWRDLIPLLAEDHRLSALDLPGHGFTTLGARNRCGLQAMAEDIAALASAEGWAPSAIIGHSAGGAVALELSQLLPQRPMVIGLNAALGTFPGLAGILFPALAKLLASMPFTATLFSGASSNQARIAALIDSTGSKLSPQGLELYRRLVADRQHVDGALKMMAQWTLEPLLARLERLDTPTVLFAATNDKTVPPDVAQTTAAKLPNGRYELIKDLGHLAHEEDPDLIAKLIRTALEDVG